jgi:hypothetical protein
MPGFIRYNRSIVRIAGLLALIPLSVQAASVPMMLISDDEADPIHSAIVRKEAWTLDAVRRLRTAADKLLREGPWTVTADRPAGLDLDPHDYYSDAPYWWPNAESPTGAYIHRDGKINPDRFTANKSALNSMCDAVFTLGSAAFFLDDTRYSQRAARIVNTWFVNTKTRMNPNLEHAQAVRGADLGRAEGVIEGRALVRAIQGIQFLEHAGVLPQRDETAVERWFEEYLRWLTQSRNGIDEKTSGNNHASWWVVQTAAVASFVENKREQDQAFDYYRDHILPRQIRADGAVPREDLRLRPPSYSAFNDEALTLTCRMAQVSGVDLWSARTKNGATLAAVIDNLLPYISDPKKWTREQTSDFRADGIYFLGFAGMGLKRPDYLAVYHKLEHPEGAWLAFVDLIVDRWEAAAHQTRH